jgi:predicted acyltransferase
LASTLLGLLIYVVDLKGHVRWGRFFEAFGVNPLYLFVQSDIFAILLGAIHVNNGSSTISLHGFFCDNLLTPVFGDYGGSLAYALLFVLLNWVIGYQLYKRKIYIKL